MSVPEHTVAWVLTECLGRLGLAGSALVVDDDTQTVGPALEGLGLQSTIWRRLTIGAEPAIAWPPPRPFDVVTVRLPRSREALEMLLHAAGSRLRKGGCLLVYGTNDGGIKSASRQVREVFGAAEVLEARRHCRVLRAALPEPAPLFRGDLSDWRTEVTATLEGGREVRWISYPGLFAHGRLDAGTKLLLEGLPTLSPGQRALDFGCGVGVIASQLLWHQPKTRVDMLDRDALAVEAARENVPSARAILGDWEALGGSRYDLIASNPPIHRGAAKDFRLLSDFIAQASRRLEPQGRLVFVAQRASPAVRLLDEAGAAYETVVENSHYRAWSACFGSWCGTSLDV
jgi:16S rRNA (guanine1207-N2)-methyltransferase